MVFARLGCCEALIIAVSCYNKCLSARIRLVRRSMKTSERPIVVRRGRTGLDQHIDNPPVECRGLCRSARWTFDRWTVSMMAVFVHHEVPKHGHTRWPCLGTSRMARTANREVCVASLSHKGGHTNKVRAMSMCRDRLDCCISRSRR